MIQCNWTLRLDEHEHLPCIHHVFPARLKDKSDRELNRIQQRRVLDMTCHQHRVGQRAEDFSRARSRLVFVSGQPGLPGESDSLARGSGQLPIAAWGGRGKLLPPTLRVPLLPLPRSARPAAGEIREYSSFLASAKTRPPAVRVSPASASSSGRIPPASIWVAPTSLRTPTDGCG